MQLKTGNIEDYLEYSFEHFTKKIIFDSDDILFFVLNLKEGQSIPRHRHEQSTLLLTVITGAGKITAAGETKQLKKGDCILVGGGDDFEISDVEKHLSVSVVLSPRPGDERYAAKI